METTMRELVEALRASRAAFDAVLPVTARERRGYLPDHDPVSDTLHPDRAARDAYVEVRRACPDCDLGVYCEAHTCPCADCQVSMAWSRADRRLGRAIRDRLAGGLDTETAHLFGGPARPSRARRWAVEAELVEAGLPEAAAGRMVRNCIDIHWAGRGELYSSPGC